MITIERKLLNLSVKTHYFNREDTKEDSKAPLTGYAHSFRSRKKLSSFKTLQIDLSKTETTMLAEMHKSTRRQVRKAAEQEFQQIIIENPVEKDLLEFQSFYNQFAKNKKTYSCNFYHMETMKLLSEQGSLVLTYIKDKENTIYCYRVYITDGVVAMNLYSASHFRMADSTEEKRLLGYANRYLIWKSILWFKEKGHEVYDMGGLTNNENIRKFKLGFGGNTITVYSGYEAKSYFAKLVLLIRNWKFSLRNVRDA